MRAKEFRSKCPIASSLDILGDKWTLIVIRDLFKITDKPKGAFTDILEQR